MHWHDSHKQTAEERLWNSTVDADIPVEKRQKIGNKNRKLDLRIAWEMKEICVYSERKLSGDPLESLNILNYIKYSLCNRIYKWVDYSSVLKVKGWYEARRDLKNTQRHLFSSSPQQNMTWLPQANSWREALKFYCWCSHSSLEETENRK